VLGTRAAENILAGDFDLPPSEWSIDYDSLDHERDDECRARSTSRKRLLASCVKLRSCWRRADRRLKPAAGSVKGIAGAEPDWYPGAMSKAPSPFRYFHSSPEIIRMVVMLYVRFPLSLRNVEDLLFQHGIDLCHETVRLWCWVGRLPTASRCARVSSLKDSSKGDRPWRRLHALGWIRQRAYSSCMG
jgi:hypothetical protein